MKKDKRRIVVEGKSKIVEVYVELEGRILITIDKKYFTFYMPVNPGDKKNNAYQFMTSIPIVIEMELVKAIVKKQTDAFREKLAKGKSKIAPRTKGELMSIN